MRPPTPSDFTLINDRSLLKDHDYMEFYMGDFENSVEYWNEGSCYLDHSVYKIFHPIFRKLRKDYDDYNVNQLSHRELEILDASLKEHMSTFNTRNLETKLNMSPVSVTELLTKLESDLSHLFQEGIKSEKTFWVLGM